MEKEEDLNNQKNLCRRVRRVTFGALIVNILLSALKMVVGILGHSQAMVADAIHSLSDTATDLAILFGVRFWSAPPDEKHPYGHWRIETLITTLIGFALVAVAIGISVKSLRNIHSGISSTPAWFTLVGAFSSILVKEILFHWTMRTGRAMRSSAVIANAWHHRSDAMSSIPAAAAILAARIKPEWAYIDQVGAIVVSCFVLYAAWNIIKSAAGDLIDEGASEALREKIRSVSVNTTGVSSVHAIRTRKVGPGYYLDLHVLVNATLTVKKGHDIAKSVKHQLLNLGPEILDVVVHLEPDTES